MLIFLDNKQEVIKRMPMRMLGFLTISYTANIAFI